MPDAYSPPSGAPGPVDLLHAAEVALTARQDTSDGLVAREELVPLVAAMVTEIGVLRDTVTARREDAEDMQADLDQARAYRLASPSKAVDPAVHTPERVAAYLTARGWRQRAKERNLWDLGGEETVHVHHVHHAAAASDYAGRTGLLVSDLAAIYGTGELQVLADIAEAGDGRREAEPA